MRFNMIRGVEPERFLWCQDGQNGKSPFIEIDEGVRQLVPLFPEFAGQHFCIVAYEKDGLMFHGGPLGGGSLGFCKPVNRWQKILWGRFASEWLELPIPAQCVRIEANHYSSAEPVTVKGLPALFRGEFSWYPLLRATVCLGDDECWRFMSESVELRGELKIEPSAWAGLLSCFSEALTQEKVPKTVWNELRQQLEMTRGEKDVLEEKQSDLEEQFKMVKTDLVRIDAKLDHYRILGIG